MGESEIITELEYARGIHEGYLTGDPGPWDGGRQDHINIIKAKNCYLVNLFPHLKYLSGG